MEQLCGKDKITQVDTQEREEGDVEERKLET